MERRGATPRHGHDALEQHWEKRGTLQKKQTRERYRAVEGRANFQSSTRIE